MDKTKFEKIKGNIDSMSKKLDTMFHNRIILAIFMICDGLCFVINPTSKIEFVARSVAFCAIIASIAILMSNNKSEHKNKKVMIVAIMVIVLGALTIIFPKVLAMNLKFLLAIFIIINALINIFNIIKLDKFSSYLSRVEDEIKEKFDDDKTDKDFNRDSITKELDKVINPLNSFIKKTNENSVVYFALNFISIILGAFLFTNQNITLIVCGVILIFTGLSDIYMYVKSTKAEELNKAS